MLHDNAAKPLTIVSNGKNPGNSKKFASMGMLIVLTSLHMSIHHVAFIPRFLLGLLSTTLRAHLTRCSLGAHLALDASGLTLCLRLCRLGLLLLLLALAILLDLLSFEDSFPTSCLTGFWALRTAFFDDVQGSTDDTALLFDCAASALFGDFLSRDL